MNKIVSSNKKVKVGMFMPIRDYSLATSVDRNPGFVNQEARDGLVGRIKGLDYVELTENVDFRKAVVINGNIFVGDNCLNDFDVFFWYSEVDPTPTSYHIEVLENLANYSFVINDPTALRIGLDKYLAHTKLKKAGLDVADFASFHNDAHLHERLSKYLREWGEILIKPRLGSFGQGIVRISDESTLKYIMGYIGKSEGEKSIFIEKFYPNDISQWCSTTIIGGELVYGYRKRKEKFVDGWKVFDAEGIGGCVDYVDPSPAHKGLALQATDVLGLDIIGFDIVTTVLDKKLMIVDENTFPGFYPDIFKEIGTDPAEKFFACIKKYIDRVVARRD